MIGKEVCPSEEEVYAIKADRDYLNEAEVVIEMDCLPILGLISGCKTPDIAMLHWIAYIKSQNEEIWHVARKCNVVADMLSQEKYESDDYRHSDEEDVGLDFFTSSYARVLTSFI